MTLNFQSSYFHLPSTSITGCTTISNIPNLLLRSQLWSVPEHLLLIHKATPCAHYSLIYTNHLPTMLTPPAFCTGYMSHLYITRSLILPSQGSGPTVWNLSRISWRSRERSTHQSLPWANLRTYWPPWALAQRVEWIKGPSSLSSNPSCMQPFPAD